MEPLAIPSSGGALFGWLHEPNRPRSPRTGVVLCPPFGPELILAHRSFLVLARLLAQAGFWTLRFDWSGSGDSWGEADSVTMDAWREDLDRCVGAMRARAGDAAVVLLGMRLGGSLALEGARRTSGVTALVLWDPIVDGGAYRDELAQFHRRQFRGGRPGAEPEAAARTEAAGFAMPPGFQDEVAAIDLTAAAPPMPTLILRSAEDPALRQCLPQWRSQGATVDERGAEDAAVWAAGELRTFAPQRLLRQVVAWLEERS